MNGKQVGTIVGVVVFLVLTWVLGNSDSLLIRNIYTALLVIWLLIGLRGISLNPFGSLWIGRTYEAMEKEAAEIGSLMEHWRYPDGSEVPPKARKKLMARQRALWQKMGSYKDANR